MKLLLCVAVYRKETQAFDRGLDYIKLWIYQKILSAVHTSIQPAV